MNRKELQRIQRFLLSARQLDPDLSVQKLSVLLEVAINREIDQSSLITRAKLTRSAASKNIAAWTLLTPKKKPGPGLLSSEPDPMNLKTRIIRLTPKGEKALTEVLANARL